MGGAAFSSHVRPQWRCHGHKSETPRGMFNRLAQSSNTASSSAPVDGVQPMSDEEKATMLLSITNSDCGSYGLKTARKIFAMSLHYSVPSLNGLTKQHHLSDDEVDFTCLAAAFTNYEHDEIQIPLSYLFPSRNSGLTTPTSVPALRSRSSYFQEVSHKRIFQRQHPAETPYSIEAPVTGVHLQPLHLPAHWILAIIRYSDSSLPIQVVIMDSINHFSITPNLLLQLRRLFLPCSAQQSDTATTHRALYGRKRSMTFPENDTAFEFQRIACPQQQGGNACGAYVCANYFLIATGVMNPFADIGHKTHPQHFQYNDDELFEW